MSDPFSNIDNEVTLDKFKNYFFKYKKFIIFTSLFLIIIAAILFYINHSQKAKNIRLSGYLVEIVSIINSDQEKAINELEKLGKLKHDGHDILSNLLLAKVYLNKQNFKSALKYLLKIEVKNRKLDPLEKIKNYFIAVAYLGIDDQQEFKKYTNLLLSYGDYWSLLGHELRGHSLFINKNYDAALKDFNKVLNEQLSTQPLRDRAQEMINNIKLNNENFN